MSVFEDIRTGCAAVVDQLHWTSLNLDAIALYAQHLVIEEDLLVHGSAEHLLGRADDSLAFFVILDTVNFGSGYFPYLEKNEGASGYFTIARRLKEWVEKEGIPSARTLREMTGSRCGEIFGQSSENPHAAELMTLFAAAWAQLGGWAIARHAGDLLGFLRTASTAGEAIAALLEMPFYRDTATHLGKPVAFYKRAQILIQDLKLAEPDHPLLRFPDLHELTIFADNVLPYVLRAEGLMTCHPWLEARIDSEQLIGAGSTEEVELRACAVHAGELLAAGARAGGLTVTSREIDYWLWQRGQALKKKSPLKRHRTRCVYY